MYRLNGFRSIAELIILEVRWTIVALLEISRGFERLSSLQQRLPPRALVRKIRALGRRNNLSGSPSESSIPPSMTIQKFAAISLLVFGTIAANDVAPSNSELEAMYDRAYRAFDAANYVQALKELDAIDARKPDLAASQNLRGVVYMRQGLYDKAEAALSEARGLDPKFWNARFNLAEIPFLKKDWTEARKRFQELLTSNAAELQGEP